MKDRRPFSTLLLSVLCFGFLCAAGAQDDAKPAEEPPSAADARSLERIHQRNKRKAQEAMAKDQRTYGAKDFAELESMYQEISANWKTPEVHESLKKFLSKWKKGNRVGCATLYLAQKSRGPERERHLETAIKKYSDCWYLNGCQVGGLARLFLAYDLQKAGKRTEVKKLVAEIEKDYAEAQDHSGRLIVEQLGDLKKINSCSP